VNENFKSGIGGHDLAVTFKNRYRQRIYKQFRLRAASKKEYTEHETSNDVIDSAILSCQGVGNCSVSGLVLSFSL
jgi:hypothetical protein